jgi:rhodanese-related sulfurtransferase
LIDRKKFRCPFPQQETLRTKSGLRVPFSELRLNGRLRLQAFEIETSTCKERLIMGMELKKNDPAKARQFFADKIAFTTGPVELSHCLKDGGSVAVVDVRFPDDYAKGHIPGAINLPKDKWQTGQGLRKDAVNVLYCYTEQCHLAAFAAVEFAAKGYSVMEMQGGFEAWKASDLEIESEITPENRWKNQQAVTA